MKWKIIIPTLLICGGAIVWLNAGNNRTAVYTTKEIPASQAQHKKLISLAQELINAYNTQGSQCLEQIFIHSRAERMTMKTESGSDPVESSIEILKRNGSNLSLKDPEVKLLNNDPNSFFVSCKLKDNGKLVCFSIVKTSKGYGLSEIRER